MKAFLAAALLLAAVLSGCSGKGSDAADGLDASAAAPVLYLNVTAGNQTHRYTSAMAASGTSGSASVSAGASATGSSSASSTGSPTGSASHSHSGMAGAAGNATKGTASNAPVNGTVPLNVTVTLGAAGLAAGKAFNWTLDWGDAMGAAPGVAVSASASATGSSSASSTGPHASATGGAHANASKPGTETGSKLPATVKHSYTTPGNYTLRFSVVPASGAPAKLDAKVQATAPANATGNATGIAPGTVLGTLLLDEEGTFTAAVQDPTSCDTAHGVAADASFAWTFPANDTNGTPATVSHVLLTVSQGDTVLDASLHFIGPDGATIKSADDNSAGDDPSETLEEDGPFEAGAYTVKVVGCVAASGDFTVHGEATLVAV